MAKAKWAWWGALGVACVGLPVAGVAHALPRLQRVIAYSTAAASPAVRPALEGEFRWAHPEECDPRLAGATGDAIELTHARLVAPGRVVRTVRPNMGATQFEIRPRADGDAEHNIRAVFFTPFRWRNRDGVWDPVVGVIGSGDPARPDPFAGVGAEMGYERAEWPGVASFEWNAAAALTGIIPAERAWEMSEREFLRVFLRTIFKAMDPCNENGGIVLETDEARAIIRFGRADKPTRAHVAVWARRGDLTQGFFVDGPDAASAREAAIALAASWTPTRLMGPTAKERTALLLDFNR